MNGQISPLSTKEILDTYFLENRARLLEIAAFLDRIDRAADAKGKGGDFRYRAFVRAVRLLSETGSERTKSLQLSFSDPTADPIESAIGLKAHGAWPGEEE